MKQWCRFNDRHLQENKGRDAAIAARDAIDIACEVVMPDFSGYPISRELSDWNDYIRENGVRATRKVIQNTCYGNIKMSPFPAI